MSSQPFQAKLTFCTDPVQELSRVAAGLPLDQSPATVSEERHLQVTERHGGNKVLYAQRSGAHPARLLRQNLRDGQFSDIPPALQLHVILDARRDCSGLASGRYYEPKKKPIQHANCGACGVVAAGRKISMKCAGCGNEMERGYLYVRGFGGRFHWAAQAVLDAAKCATCGTVYFKAFK
jgi:hypothetical protein